MERGGNSILAGTLLATLLFSPGLRSGSSEPTQQQEQAAAKQPAHRLLLSAAGSELSAKDRTRIQIDAKAVYLREFEDAISNECEKGELKPATAPGKKAPAGSDPCQLTLNNFMIALLPDPVHTHLALGFDRGIDAVEEGLQDEGYLFVRSMMPWDPKTHPESEDHVERDATELAEEAREQQPGLMLFRAQKPGPNPLLVLVVGEAPTGGINKDQFRNAVLEMEKLLGIDPKAQGKLSEEQRKTLWQVSPTSPGLRILGPSSSGSLQSLLDVLQCKDSPTQKPHPCYPLVSIHSGTVSSYNAIKEFDNRAASLNAHFVSFQESDDVMIERFQQFLTGRSYGARGYSAGKIALLSEDESAYGTATKRSGESPACGDPHGKSDSRPLEPEKDREAYSNVAEWWNPSDWWPHWLFQPLGRWIFHPLAEWAEGIGGDPDRLAYPPNKPEADCMLTLYFPREISQLRAAYQKDVVPTTAEAHGVPRDILPDYSDVPGSDDTVASYSDRQLPLSQEAVMLGVVSELKKHQTQFILVRASDPMDTLFLVRYLRTAYPQGRLVTLGADLLLRREAEDPRFHGLLSLSTYAMATAASHGFRDYEEHDAERVFPSTMEAGTYNATRSLLSAWVGPDDEFCVSGEPQQQCRYTLRVHSSACEKAPGDNAADCAPILYQYGWRQRIFSDGDFFHDAPPVRLLALGRDQYWPIAALGPYESEARVSLLPRAPGELVDPPAVIEIPKSWHVVQLVGFGLAFFFCWSLLSSSVFCRLQSSARFAPAVRDRRLTLILVAGFTVEFILLILMWPALHGAHSVWGSIEPLLLMALIAVFVTTLIEGVVRALADAPKCALASGPAPATPLFPKGYFWFRASTRVGPSTVGAMQIPAIVREPELRERVTRKLRVKVPPFAQWKGMAEVVIFAAFSLLMFWGVGKGEPDAETSALVRFYSTLRTVQLTSGLSFIMPTFFFLTVWLWWAEHVSSGYTLLDDRRPRLPSGMTNDRVTLFRQDAFPDLCAIITPGPFRFIHYLLVSVALTLAGSVIMGRHHPMMSLERPLLEWAMTVLFLLAICGIVVSTLQTWSIWLALRRLLVQLDSCRLRDSFKVIEGFSWRPIWRFGAGSLDEFLRIFSRNREAMDCAVNTVPKLSSFGPRLEHQLKLVIGQAADAKSKRPFREFLAKRRSETELIRKFGTYQEISAQAAGCALDLLAHDWDLKREEGTPSRLEAVVPWATGDDVDAVCSKLEKEESDVQVRACERFVAMSYTSFVMVLLVRIRTLIMAIGGMYVLTLVAISQYPFEPKGALQLLLVALLAFVVAIVGLVFAQIHRDTVLSNLTDTKPGELGIDYFVRMATFVALPLFSLLASQFPSMNRFFYSWLQPAVEALNH